MHIGVKVSDFMKLSYQQVYVAIWVPAMIELRFPGKTPSALNCSAISSVPQEIVFYRKFKYSNKII